MFGHRFSPRVGLISVATCLVATASLAQAPADAPKPSAAASAAASASPDLTANLAKELGSTPEQAAGAAGALFGVAKTKMSATDFAQVSKAVPGMQALLKAAPAGGKGGGKSGAAALAQMAGTAGGLANAATAFQSLGLSPDMVGKAIPVLTSFVTKSGGADVGKLLAGALK
ncbi:MAG TPA: DUF2780 domain-containing protein [Vicinamibacterales bacterium]|jgi:hypothetical protein